MIARQGTLFEAKLENDLIVHLFVVMVASLIKMNMGMDFTH
jgi:hypothetical protein